jgi:site-specific recombinase XerD
MLALESENKTRHTLESYCTAVVLLGRWLRDNGHTDDITELTAEQLRGWLAELSSTRSASTASSRYTSVRLFLSWCIAEGELDTDPMANIKRPIVPEKPAAMLSPEQVRDLLATASSRDLTDLRDRAILHLFADTGMRLNTLSGITLPDLDLSERLVSVTAKGRRQLVIPYGANTAQALDRYVRARRRTRHADRPWLWVSMSASDGRLTGVGIHRMLQRRGARIGVPGLHAHMFRHTFADAWLRAGGEETDLMEIAGWRTRQMMARYGAARRADRAREAHRRLSPMDNL